MTGGLRVAGAVLVKGKCSTLASRGSVDMSVMLNVAKVHSSPEDILHSL